MITQIEIDGFKTFKDFKVELAPFQAIVGANGSGKSNLFDALHLLSRLAEFDLRTAFQGMRGSADDMFTMLPNGERINRIRIAVEMLVNRTIQDSEGELELRETGTAVLRKELALKYRRLRYELEISLGNDEHGQERPYVTHESLKSLPQEQDTWAGKYGLSSQNGWLSESRNEQVSFFDTKLTPVAILESIEDELTTEVEQPVIYLYPDGDKNIRTKRFYALEIQRTVLNRTMDIDYPHAFAAREEMRSWQFLHPSHEALHQPSSVNAPAFLSIDGSNLPTMIARLQREDPFFINDIARDLANLVPDVVGIELKKHPILNEYTIWVQYEDGRSFPSQVLSDGTLRLLALATLNNDPEFHGVLCFEEPENGIDPSYLKEIAHLLRQLATDFNDPQEVEKPLRQVLVTTHSPTLISQPAAIDALLFAFTVTRVKPGKYAFQITQMVPVITSNTGSKLTTDVDKAEESYTIDQIKEYLNSENLDKARASLGRK